MIMAKAKKKEFIDFLDARIAKLEELIVERNGTVPMDFDKLDRYWRCREHYDAGEKQ